MKAFTTIDEYGSNGRDPTDFCDTIFATVGIGARNTPEHTTGAVLPQRSTNAPACTNVENAMSQKLL